MKSLLKKIISKKTVSFVKDTQKNLILKRFKKDNIKPFKSKKFKKGFNLVGDITGNDGFSQSMRILEKVIYKKIPYNLSYFSTESVVGSGKHLSKINNKFTYGINLFHINNQDIPYAYKKYGKKVWDSHYNIGYFAWELEELPKNYVKYIDFVDEIWTPSDFASDTYRKYTKKPVITIPHSVYVNVDDDIKREDFNLPKNRFLFLMMYATHSTYQRKNPLSVVKAFKHAFKKNREDVGLVIKVQPSAYESDDILKLKEVIKGYDNIYLIVENLEEKYVHSLMNVCDAYISLHRAEGFGLPLAEAMLLKKPVIATAFSGNLLFMNKTNSCLVDYKKVKLKKDIPPFEKNFSWASPNISQASFYMKKLVEERSFYDKIKNNAKKYVSERLSKEAVLNIVLNRFNKINSSL